MGTAGTERFVLALGGPHLEYGAKDEGIRDYNDGSRNNNVLPCYNEQLHLIGIGVGARELQQREDVTEIVVDDVRITECQSQHESSMDHGARKSHQV